MRRRAFAPLVPLLVGTLVLAACSSSSKSSTSASSSAGSDTLHLDYLADMSTPDPDVFYDI